MIIGPGCSVGASTTAEVAPFYSLTQVLLYIVDLSMHWRVHSIVENDI